MTDALRTICEATGALFWLGVIALAAHRSIRNAQRATRSRQPDLRPAHQRRLRAINGGRS